MSENLIRLNQAMRAFNIAELAAVRDSLSLTWLGDRGPAFLLGTIRVRGIYRDQDGRHWADAALAVESLAHQTPEVEVKSYLNDCTGSLAEGHDQWVCTSSRGLWNAVIATVTEIARALDLTSPVEIPAEDWCRGWQDDPDRTDEQELAWIAHGGHPTATYLRDGGQWL